ncbi:MAG: Hsp20/alpha crystallin family protein [Desulfosalsimonas sp.]
MFNIIPWRKRQRREQPRSGDRLPERFRDFFGAGDFFPSWLFSETRELAPAVDVKEGRKHITVRAEIPGMDKKNLDISLENGILRIEGEKRKENEESGENYYRRESAWGRFSRRIELPAEVDENDVEATYKRGVLSVKLKKTREAEQKRIKVKSG